MSIQLPTVNSKQQTRELMASAPFFSIIIPVYNVAQYLKECLDSVLAQTFGDWECLCVDDGSTDGAGEILDEYAKKDARFRVIHQRNGGVSAARNRTLDLARGAFVCFADGDDIAYPWWLATFAHFQRLTNADLVRTQFPYYVPYCDVAPDLNKVSTQVFEDARSVFEWGWDVFGRKGYSFLYAVRRSCLEGAYFLRDVRLKEDILFDLTFLPQVRRAVQCDVTSYWYRWRAGSAVKSRGHRGETQRRILHLVRIYQAQEVLFALAQADCRGATSWVILYDLVMMVVNGEWADVPKLIAHCRQAGALTLEVLPWRWQVLLRCCEGGTIWPIRVYSRLSWCKWEVLGWWMGRRSRSSRGRT